MMMEPEYDDRVEPRDTSQIEIAMRSIDEGLETLSSLLKRLEKRTTPILSPNMLAEVRAERGSETAVEDRSPVLQNLQRQARFLQVATDDLRHIIDRLQI